jgi:basic amino acid/polyamine antiporter, APA family
MSQLFRTKPLATILAQAAGIGERVTLKRTLSVWGLIGLGIGVVIGAGIFVRTAVAAGTAAGPAVTFSYVVAGIACALAGLCYAEFASMIPVSGSAYTYSYATMGELVAWIIGWDLALEYGVGAATVAIAWSEYCNRFLQIFFNFQIPYQWCHSPFEALVTRDGVAEPISTISQMVGDVVVQTGYINLPALGIVVLLSLLLVRGTEQSSYVNGMIVLLKLAIVFAFIWIGWGFINPSNHVPYIVPNESEGSLSTIWSGFGHYGWTGILRGAGIVFFAFIGFDGISTAAQEAKNPKRDMPIGILGSLALCTILYILFSYVLTGVANYQEFNTVGKEASVAYAIRAYMVGYEWLESLITVAILAGFSSVILVLLLGQSRVFYAMAKDGLLPKPFAALHERFHTPHKTTLILMVMIGLFSAFIPGDIVGEMTSIGTLFAFVLVCIGILIMRKTQPNAERPFRAPFVPFVPILGAVVCLIMMAGLGVHNWLRLLGWLAVGLVIYFAYSRKHSLLAK